MEPVLDKATIIRPSYIASVELPPRIGPVNVEDLKADLSDEFSLVSSNLDISQRNSLDSKEHIQVCLRIRPFTASEKENESQDCVSIQDSTSIILKGPKNSMICRQSEKNIGQMVQRFTFSRVFGPETTQEEFFDGTVKQPVQDFLEGRNRLIFTYGVTNAGKTYTFQGTEADIGILPRTMDMLFKSIHGKLYPDMDFKPLRCRDYIRLTKEQVREEVAVKNSILRLMKEVWQNFLYSARIQSIYLEEPIKEPEQPNMSVESCMKFSVWVSFCEIYNECIYDLLLPVSNDKKRRVLRLAQDIKGCSYVKDLQWIQISDSKEAFKLLKLGLKHQSIACTKLNTYSSRSHSIFTVKLLKIEDSEAPNVTRVSELALCDLAGSERCTKTRNEGDRLKESGNINTSLLILGKCINALKNSQQSKLQLHIPFRESKLTHFLQGFFSGKGKVYMIVNISQCAAAFDETLNVLKFSAIAQKVSICVLDSSNASQEQPFVQKSARDASLINNADTKMQVARKRATVLWDRSLEDVIEDEDDDDDLTMPEEEEDNKVTIGEEEYQRLLNIIEHLKSKLINERKDKLLLELKIREEVTQEFTQYFAQRETDFRQCLSHERELLEKTSEQRLEIYKDLVNECAKNLHEEQEIKDSHCNERAGMLKMTTQNKRIQELMHIVEQKDNVISRLQALISHLETTVKDYKIEGTQSSESVKHVLDVGKKRCFESKPTQEEEPPTKKGSIRSACKGDAVEQKKIEEMQQNILEKEAVILALQERSESLDCQLAILKEELTNEKREKEGFSRQMANLCRELSSSKERASGLSEELQQCQTSYGKIASELDTQKAINKEQEEKIKQLTKEVEASSQNIIVKVSQIKAMQTKIDELHKLDLESCTVDVDLVNLKDFLEDSQKDKPEKIQIYSLNTECQTSNIADVRRESSFHCSIEGIWKECKQIIKASSQKSNRIQELLQQVENLQKSISEVKSENNQLKIQLDDITNQGNLSIKEKENLVNQLQEQLQEKICESEKRVAEDRSTVIQLEKQSASHKEKIKELESLLEAYRAKDDNAARLEQILKEKESIILKMERDVKDLEKKCMNSEKKIQELNDQETKLKEDVIQLKNNLKTIEHSRQGKEREEEELKNITEQEGEKLNKELSESSAFIQQLEMDCQRKDEEYTDLKEKLADAKKQIEQVQKEVCTMRSEEKLLKSKVNEHEKTKKQFAEELDMKQRTIQKLKKELLGNEQIEEISKQYQNACKDLRAKEKIIEDMRLTLEEQEQTQLEQDQVLEAKLEETERLVSELEEWKQKHKELKKSNSEWQQQIKKHEDKNIDAVRGELISLQERLKEIEEKCKTDRKKWVEEKMGLITQVKEAENHRNREMKKFAEDRERHVKQQTEVEKLTAQLSEKDNDLQKWRKERDQLVAALEVQLSTLVSSNIQKDKEIEELKHTTLTGSGKVSLILLLCILISCSTIFLFSLIHPKCLQDHSDTVLDSSEVSTENGKGSRFPKPEMEIQFTPLHPNKMEVKHQGSALPVTVKMPKTRRKRKSNELDEVSPKLNTSFLKFTITTTQSFRKEYPLRKQVSTSSTKSTQKKDGTLQKLGDFFQSSPTIIHSKAKKLIATISSPKSTEVETHKAKELKPKRTKRKLYSTDISFPLDITGDVVSDILSTHTLQ
uniref:Kinesin family member 20B n=1 Tax=Chelydra serpentina TaxID=8475 RepID=A0A8C3TEU5_CHESE